MNIEQEDELITPLEIWYKLFYHREYDEKYSKFLKYKREHDRKYKRVKK